MGQRKQKKRKKKSQPPAAGQKTIYPYSPRVSLIVGALVCLFWIVLLLIYQADLSRELALVGLGVIVLGILFCTLFAIGRYELDAVGISIVRPLRHKRFKWQDLDELEHAEGYHAPTDHYVPAKTRVPYLSGRTAFSVSNWVKHYPRLREDLKEHLHQASRARHKH